MMFVKSQSIVSVDWLAKHIDAVEIRVLYASLQATENFLSAENYWRSQHIPYSSYFDMEGLDSVRDEEFIDPVKFSDRLMDSGVGNGNKVIIYDSTDGSSAALLWWLLRSHGHYNVVVLDGGMRKWVASGEDVSNRPRRPRRHNFTSVLQPKMFVDDKLLEEAAIDAETRIFDTDADDPVRELLIKSREQVSRPEMHGGSLIAPSELFAICSDLKIDLRSNIIITGGEMTSNAMLAFLLHLLGAENIALHYSSTC